MQATSSHVPQTLNAPQLTGHVPDVLGLFSERSIFPVLQKPVVDRERQPILTSRRKRFARRAVR